MNYLSITPGWGQPRFLSSIEILKHSILNFSIRLIAVIFFLQVTQANAQHCDLTPPANLYISDLSSCSAILHWNSENSALKYVVSYSISGSGHWSPNVNVGTNTSYTFTDLLPNTSYIFTVLSKCSDGTKSKKVKVIAITPSCSLPEDVSVTSVNSSTAKIVVTTSCAYDSLFVECAPLGGSLRVRSFGAAPDYTLDGLSADSVYLINVSTCPKSLNNWTSTDTLYLNRQPNIILVILDDARNDYFSCNGAPPFVHTPNIDRIANEGINFQRTYAVSSLCAPSRATVATGLFTLKTGVSDNSHTLDTAFATIPEVLHANGYYTALIGKNHNTFLQGNVPEFQFFMELLSGHYNYNGQTVFIDKEDELACTDTALALIKRVNDPLFMWLAYSVPHRPIKPLPSFKGDYAGFPIPWKPDTARYTVNYPSFLYSGKKIYGYSMDTTYRSALEDVAGVDSCMGEIFNALESANKLDNTLIIFISDNGYMMGNHYLQGKSVSYEPSIRIPLFIRYPAWFAPESRIKDQFATNMDIAPTIYEAAGIDYNGVLDGHSLRDLYNGNFNRQELFYIMPFSEDNWNFPSLRCFRDPYYKYVNYSCIGDTVEEFFDMVNDSLELTNQVNNSAYHPLLERYRTKLDSMRIAWQDTDEGLTKDCFIKNPYVLKQLHEEAEETPLKPTVYPSLTSGPAELYIPWKQATIRLYNDQGDLLSSWETAETYSAINLGYLPDGIYLLNFSNNEKSFTEKIMLFHQ